MKQEQETGSVNCYKKSTENMHLLFYDREKYKL